MVAPYIDPSLGVLRSQLRSQHPGIVIYWIGDTSHQSRPSDHNPEADGSVDAIDLMLGDNFTRTQAIALVNKLVLVKDRRLKYIIWDGRIWFPNTGWETYTGSDKHRDHVHISRNDWNEASTAPWDIVTAPRKVTQMEFSVKVPALKQGDDDADMPGYNMITRIQRLCGFTGKDVDGNWGPKTTDGIERTADVPNGSKMTEEIYRKLFGLSR